MVVGLGGQAWSAGLDGQRIISPADYMIKGLYGQPPKWSPTKSKQRVKTHRLWPAQTARARLSDHGSSSGQKLTRHCGPRIRLIKPGELTFSSFEPRRLWTNENAFQVPKWGRGKRNACSNFPRTGALFFPSPGSTNSKSTI